MISKIDPEICTGCGICVDACPTDVIRLDHGGSTKAVIRYHENCMTCYNCELECPEDAIYVDPFRKPIKPLISYASGG